MKRNLGWGLCLFLFFASLLPLLEAEPIKVPKIGMCREAREDELRGTLPFISDMNFLNISDVVIDECTEEIDPSIIKQGDIVCLGAYFLPWFVDEVHPKIKAPYILITCDVDNWLPPPLTRSLLYEAKCAAWFGMNMSFSCHPKLRQLPMGQSLSKVGRGIDHLFIDKFRKLYAKKPYQKQHLLYMNHYPRTYGDRDKIVQLFKEASFCFSRNHSSETYLCRTDFLEELSASTFTISPVGLETDCFRHWEALALDAIPILEHSFLDPLFDDAPVSFVHRWEEIDEVFLYKEQERLKNIKTDKHLFEPWAKAIKNVQAQVRSGDLSFSQCEAMLWSDEDLSTLTDILIALRSDPKARIQLLYKGYLSSIHALQVAQELPALSRIYLHDVMLDNYIWDNFDSYLTQPCLLAVKNKIVPLFSESAFEEKLVETYSKETICVLDLSYFRHGLHSFDLPKKIRHSLKNDIQALYNKLGRAAALCGNMIQNQYVKEVLESFAKDNGLILECKGNFWWLKRAVN